MDKLLEQRKAANAAYQQRRRDLGWKQLNILLPEEVKKKVMAYKDALLKEYIAAHPEEDPRVRK